MTDFLHTVGGSFYSPEEFEAEAESVGISRRIARLPKDLVVGESRVYLVFGAGRDSAPKKCSCGAQLTKPQRTAQGEVESFCEICYAIYRGKVAAHGEIRSYFVPTAVEVVVRIAEPDVRAVAEGYVELERAFDAEVAERVHLIESPDVSRVDLTIKGGREREVLEFLERASGAELDIDLLANVVGLPGARVVAVGREVRRGCGYRAHGGTYLVGSGTESPLIPVNSPIKFVGQHFRGLRALTPQEADECRQHIYFAGDLTLPLAA